MRCPNDLTTTERVAPLVVSKFQSMGAEKGEELVPTRLLRINY